MELWTVVLSISIILNLRNFFPLWHFRFFRALWSGMRLHSKAGTRFQPQDIFLPTTSSLQAPLPEMDFNFHKSNSTYFTDLDAVRAYHSGILFGPLFLPGPGIERCNLIVASVMCNFKREIKPYEKYETSTKVASWDEKWIYMVTHFVQRKKTARRPDIVQCASSKSLGGHTRCQTGEGHKGAVFASAITRLVFKRGRLTVSPARAMGECGLPCAVKDGFEQDHSDLLVKIESSRKANLAIVQLRKGWDEVHDLFKEQEAVLGSFTGVVWC